MKAILIALLSILFLCPASCRSIDGIDVSGHQGKINWEQVSASLPKDAFVYVKCSEGKTFVDANYKTNAKNAKARGLYVGGYHYFRMTSSAHDQFLAFKKCLDNIDFDLVPMVDVETTDGKPIREVQDSLRVFLHLLEKEYGKKPMIYGTMRSYNTICAPVFNQYHLYIGRYGNKAPGIRGSGTYTIWQYSESIRIKGCKKEVDACKFNRKYSIKDILL